MSTHVIPIESPIDAMLLLHDALRAEAAHVERLVSQLQEGSTLQPFRQAFYRWTMALAYHADTEDSYMTPLLPDVPAARDCEQAHQRLADRLEEVQQCLTEEIGRTMLIARTQRHLFGAVVQARIAQDDHLEEEEAFILPVIRRQLSVTQQEEVIRHLLIDHEAEDPGWHLDWLQETLPPREGQFLADLAAQIHAGGVRERRELTMSRA
jgi:hemerythrin-like domain-containing protein